MTRRPGMSMAEVLVALFLLALGTIAILTMFPLGMYHMGQALKDDRASQAANQANSYMRNYWRTNVVEVGDPTALANEAFYRAFNNPNDPTVGAPANPAVLPLNSVNNLSFASDPSYPVCVDPMGFGSFWGATNPPAMQFWVGNQNTPRRSLAGIVPIPSPHSQRVCSLMDGFTFDMDGSTPNLSVPSTYNTMECELRYNWLWVLQRPRNSDTTTATMKVVVFDTRAFLYAPPNTAEKIFSTLPPSATGGIANVPGSTMLSFPSGTQLGVNKGKWIADVTCLTLPGAGGNPPSPWVRNFNFYRIVSITDTGSTVDVEIQEPLRQDSLSALDRSGNPMPALPIGQTRSILVMAGVSEVFEFPVLAK